MTDLTEVLSHYGLRGQVVARHRGPMVQQIEFAPAAGTKIKTVRAVLPDVVRELGVSSLRVEALPESGNLGFELPAPEYQVIDFKQILAGPEFAAAKGELPICLGVDVTGHPCFADVAKMPHLLVAGTTGSGKSVGLNSFILSLIKRKTPQELKLVLIDPKRIEFSMYNNQQYMLAPVVTDNAEAVETLAYLQREMERRYRRFEQSGSRNLGEYNRQNPPLPYILCVIDEFADLVAADKNAEKILRLLAQKSRAAGIHIMLATQRPSVDVVTGLLKANFPTRLAYKVASAADSRTILDMTGAEDLLGRGDALFLPQNGELKRVHGAYIDDAGIREILAPYAAKVAPLEPKQTAEKQKPKAAAEKGKAGWFARLWRWWTSLKVRERKTIIAGLAALLNWLLGNKKQTTVK